MAHGDLAQVAAVVGALGSVIVLLPHRRWLLLGGFAVLAVAEALLAIALIPRSDLERLQRPLAVAGLVVVAALIAGLAYVLVRRPALTPVVLLLAAPFRIPVDLGSQHAFLLLPLYGVLAAAVLAFCWQAIVSEPRGIPLFLAAPVAAFIALTGISLLWSRDLKQGTIELVFFLFPFAALFAVVARAPFPRWLPRTLWVILVGLTTAFALIGLFQRATHRLFYAPSLEVDNAFTSYFRVSSVFRDPSLFGRYLALGTAVIVAAYLLGRVRLAIAAPLLAVLFAALWFSYSQSSMVTIFVVVTGLALVAGTPSMRRVVAVVAAVIAISAATVVAVHVQNDTARKSTSDRSRLVSVTWKVFRNHPLAGVGVGAQPKASREEAAPRVAASRNHSHTTPLTVAAELGVIGILAYLAFLAAAGRTLLSVTNRERALGLCLAAVFVTLFVHSLFYSGFFEDPITWGSVALAGAALAAYPIRGAGEEGDGTGPSGRVATLDASLSDRSAPLAADRAES
jgi:putative inorganic carbon (hco3(-)) transporter